jgi:DNA-binding transcriptional ArsR family regulator
MSSRSIRSSAHRQILVWLRHGSSTVSEIATQFGMRMPHASLACRQLREAGLISRDESGGLRNAPLFLSQQGVERLTEDAVSKMLRYADVLSSAKKPMVLHADDANVLLAYTHLPETSLVFVPDPAAVDGPPSSGNKGGVWVLAPKRNIRWYHLRDGTPAEPPLSRGNTLADFEPSVERVGLVRGEVFEVRGEARLAEAQFFPTGGSGGPPPSRLQLGDVVVGTVAGSSHAYAPQQGLRCHLHSALNRSLLLQSLGQGALEIGDRHATKHRRLPYGVLKEWLMLKHPRMNTSRIEELYEGLVTLLEEGASTSPSVLEREALMDFGRVSWTTASLEEGYLDLYGMTGRGASALLRFVANSISTPFIVDWPFEDVGVEFVSRLLAHPLCRSFVSRRGPPPSLGSRRSVLFDGEEMGFISVRQGRVSTIEVQLNAPGVSSRRTGTAPSPSPLNALELMTHHSVTTTESFTGKVFEGEGGRILAEALRLYPSGDEQQSNVWEREHPLAAWIASPVAHRPARWMRLHTRLPKGWTDLLGVDALSLEHLPLAMLGASRGWQRLVLRRIQATAQVDAGVLVQWRNSVKANPSSAPAYATCLLCALHPERPEEAAVFREAAEVWFREPMCEQEVLESVLQERVTDENVLVELRSGWRQQAEKQPKKSLLYAWALALRIAQHKEPWVPEMQRMLMERLPAEWWAVFAEQWLTTQLGSHTGRTWLQSFTCSWVVQLARPEGERTRFPGLDVLHSGFRMTTENLLGANLLTNEDENQPLRDLYEMVYAYEQDLPVPLLSTHPFAGWLVRPVHQWPRFGSEVLQVGDPKVGELLFAQSFAARNPAAGR